MYKEIQAWILHCGFSAPDKIFEFIFACKFWLSHVSFEIHVFLFLCFYFVHTWPLLPVWRALQFIYLICGGSRIDNFLSPSPDQRLYEDFVGSLLRRKKEKRLTHSLAMSMSRATSIPMDLSSVEGLVQRSVDTINAAIGSTARDHGR